MQKITRYREYWEGGQDSPWILVAVQSTSGAGQRGYVIMDRERRFTETIDDDEISNAVVERMLRSGVPVEEA